MKAIFTITVLLLIGCSKSTPTPANLAGTWSFSTSEYSGSFTLQTAADGYYNLSAGSFVYKGKALSYAASNGIQFQSSDRTTIISLNDTALSFEFKFVGFVSSDFKSMNCSNVRYQSNGVDAPPQTQSFTCTKK